jgi:hypothetical protein
MRSDLTALRFHFGGDTGGIFARAGADIVDAAFTWQSALLLDILFHHSNIGLPENMGKVVLVITPRMRHISKVEARRERIGEPLLVVRTCCTARLAIGRAAAVIVQNGMIPTRRSDACWLFRFAQCRAPDRIDLLRLPDDAGFRGVPARPVAWSALVKQHVSQ